MIFSDPKQAAVNAELCRSDLYWYARYMFRVRRGYKWLRAEHHKIICDALMRVFSGETTRLIINVPPRYSKTELGVINFIAWSLGHYPDAEFIHTSYSGPLALNNALQVREIVAHPASHAIFPACALRTDRGAADHWQTTRGGVIYARGAGGPITGFGAGKMRPEFGGAIVIDDPHKADEARSDTIRKNVISWFQNTLESRKNDPKRTPIILIMQRLHEEDLAGWLLAGGNGEQWEHVNLPALRADGSALWPDKHDAETLRRMERAAPYVFSGQYQQRPAPAQGGVFKPDAIQVIDATPAGVRWVRAWDLAATIDGGDWTVGALLGQTTDKRFIIGDIVRLQGGPDEVQAAIKNTADRDGRSVRVSLPQDPGQAGKVQVKSLTTLLRGYSVSTSPESGDKITRAEPFGAQVNVGNVMMLRGEWNAPLIDEMRNFPNGKYDDQVDALSRGFEHFVMKRGRVIISDDLSAWAAGYNGRRRA